MKYYYREHLLGYEQVKTEGTTAWGEIHGVGGFDNFSSRAFLDEILPRLRFSASRPTVLEYGCGTGPGTCFLAERGFQVDGIDLIPLAIEMARELARERGLDIDYQVQDICELPHEGKKYDMIVDSYCLQGIVTEDDRQRVFSAVRARLKPEGRYVISTAMFDEHRFRPETRIVDAATCTAYNGYGESEFIDARTGVVLRKLGEESGGEEDALKIDEDWYLPVRRHRKPAALRTELEAAGFDVLYQDESLGGNMACAVRGSQKDV